MNQDDRPRKPIPLILWALIGFVLVLGFLFILRAANPPGAGMTPASPGNDVPASSP